MAKRTRNVPVLFWVSPQEMELIRQKMAQFGTDNLSAYLRKMAIDGYVLQLDLPELKELVSLLRRSSNNLNQLTSMLPFRSLSISTLEGRKGVYVLITKDEDRAQSLRLRKPSVRKKLSETKAEPGHTDKKKVREQER